MYTISKNQKNLNEQCCFVLFADLPELQTDHDAKTKCSFQKMKNITIDENGLIKIMKILDKHKS